jgi:hypothetical protein
LLLFANLAIIQAYSFDEELSGLYGKPCRVNVNDHCGIKSWLICKGENHDSILGVCEHKNIFPLNEREAYGTIVLTIVMTMAVVSGVGGSGITIPLFICFYNLDTREAIAITAFT